MKVSFHEFYFNIAIIYCISDYDYPKRFNAIQLLFGSVKKPQKSVIKIREKKNKHNATKYGKQNKIS